MSKMMTPEEQLEDLQRRFELLEGERKATYETAQQTIKTNREIILQLKDENKSIRTQMGQIKNENEQRPDKVIDERAQELIRVKNKVDNITSENDRKTKQLHDLTQQLKNLSELSLIPGGDATIEGRQIRVLENRLDKAIIKLNEAQSIQRTYEKILKKLQEERVGFDTNIRSIEKSLQAKQRDYEELLLLSHDAYHAKEMAQAELHRFEQGVMEERNQRDREVQEKKGLVQQRVDMNQRLEQRQKVLKQQKELEKAGELAMTATATMGELASGISFSEVESERQKLQDFEDAFKRLKEATGVTEVNEVIQKFVTQEETQKNLMTLTKEYQSKIDTQLQEISIFRSQLDELKYSASGNVGKRQIAEELQNRLSEANSTLEKNREKYEKLVKILIDVNAGVAHLALKLNEVKLEGGDSVIDMSRDSVEEVLAQCEQKMAKLLAAADSEIGPADLLAYEEKLFERAQNDIRVRIADDADGDDDEEFKDDESVSRKVLRNSSLQIIEKQLKKARAVAKKAAAAAAAKK